MHYIEAIQPVPFHYPVPKVFLAGCITNCPDWQSEVVQSIEDKDCVVLNPRQKNFPIQDPSAALAQITWEYHALHLSDVITFWFAAGSLNPIVLYEYGAALERQKASSAKQHMVVGCDPEYSRIYDVKIQTRLISPAQILCTSFEEFVRELRHVLTFMLSFKTSQGLSRR